jgi:hypothetical protein
MWLIAEIFMVFLTVGESRAATCMSYCNWSHSFWPFFPPKASRPRGKLWTSHALSLSCLPPTVTYNASANTSHLLSIYMKSSQKGRSLLIVRHKENFVGVIVGSRLVELSYLRKIRE